MGAVVLQLLDLSLEGSAVPAPWHDFAPDPAVDAGRTALHPSNDFVGFYPKQVGLESPPKLSPSVNHRLMVGRRPTGPSGQPWGTQQDPNTAGVVW